MPGAKKCKVCGKVMMQGYYDEKSDTAVCEDPCFDQLNQEDQGNYFYLSDFADE